MTVLADTEQRLRALRPDHPDSYSACWQVPDEPGWFALDGLAASGTVTAWCAEARHRDNPSGLASVAATAVAGALTHAVIGRVTAALVLERRAWDVGLQDLAVHRTPDGYLDRTAVRSPSLLVLPDDPLAGEPHTTVVADLPVLLDRLAAGAVATLAPVFDAVREATRYGTVPLWNGVADAVRGVALYVPLFAGTDPHPAREIGAALVDALIARGARIRATCSSSPVRWRDRDHEIPVRGACCLYYKTDPQVERAGDQYCTTCPFLGADDRERRFGTFLDGLAPGAVTAGGR